MPLPTVTGEFTLGGDPSLSFTQSGKAVASFSVVASKPKKDDNDQWVDDKQVWMRVTVWDKEAEHVAESLEKGSRVVISGQLFEDKYTDKEGNERTSLNIQYPIIGPSLKFATAKVTKAARSDTAAPTTQTDNPWATAPADNPPPF